MTCMEPSQQSMSYICKCPRMSLQNKLELLTYDMNKEDSFKKTVRH